MRTLRFVVLAAFAVSARADLSYDLRETTIAHPSLGFKTKENIVHVVIKTEMVATRQYDMVQVVESEANLITLIDYRTKTFATANLDEINRADDQGFDSIQEGVRSELIVSGQAAVWNGTPVKRDIARTAITGGEAPGELLVTSDWVEDVPGLADSRRSLEAGDHRHAQDLEAQIQIMFFQHPERFADGLKIRKNAQGRGAFQIHSLAEMRLAADAPMLQAIGPEYKNRPIMSVETELTNLSADQADGSIFLVPSGFNKVDFTGLLREQYMRRHF